MVQSSPVKRKIGGHNLSKSGISDEDFEKIKQLELEYEQFHEQFNQKCMTLADTIPIKVYWRKDSDPAPWTCPHSILNENDEWFCDQCPVQGLCLLPKNWSK